jgi:hypothetical protein
VPPRVWYGMTCLLIRNAIGCVPCSVERGMALDFVIILCESLEPHGTRGTFVWEPFALQAGTVCSGICSKA